MKRMNVALATVTALGLAISAGCSRNETPDAVLAVTAVETSSGETTYQFQMPDEVPAGATRISLTNNGAEAHHAQLFRLDDGKTMADLAETLASGEPAATSDVGRFVGGTGLVDPGGSSQADAILDLRPGAYAFICFVEGADGSPHLAHGMLQPLEVTDENDQSSPPPEADEEISLIDYAFDTPDRLPGDGVLAISNRSSTEPHEMIIGRFHEDATVDDVRGALNNGTPAPMTSIGGMQALPPGASAHLQLDLPPGRYVFICHIPSPDGHAHYTKGMIREVIIT